MTLTTQQSADTTVHDLNTAVIDARNKIVTVTWDGIVDLEAASTILNFGADRIADESVNKLILNRTRLNRFDTEARIWIKEEIIKRRGAKLSRKLRKLAIVKEQSAAASIFGNFITSSIRIVYPRLRVKKFDAIEEATKWAMED